MGWKLGLLGLALIACQIVCLDPMLSPDAVGYMSIARSLAQHGTLSRMGQPQVFYPPAYPILLSPVFLVWDEPFLVISLVNVVLLATFGFLVHRWCGETSPEAAPYIAMLTIVNATVAMTFRRPLSETAFCPLLYGLAIVYDRILANRLPRSAWPAVISLQCVTALTRQVGIFAGVGFSIASFVQAIRGQRTWASAILISALAVGPAALTVAAWTKYDAARATELGSYVDYMSSGKSAAIADWPLDPVSTRLSEGMRVRVGEVGQLTIPGLYNSYSKDGWLGVNSLLFAIVFVFVLIGWRQLLSRGDVMAYIWPVYFLFHVWWPFGQSGRFTMPMVPVLCLCLWHALERLGICRRYLFVVLIAAHFAVSMGHFLVIDAPRARALSSHWPQLREIAERHDGDSMGVTKSSFELAPPLAMFLQRDVPVVAPGQAERGSRFLLEWEDAKLPIECRRILESPPDR